MKELDLLKKDWNKEKHPKVSSDSIYKMILKKSSSVVKWIFIISLIEIGIGLLSGLFYHPNIEQQQSLKIWQKMHLPVSVISIAIGLYFLYKFYINYRTINTTNSVKELLTNIINTRRTVKQYVLVNLFFLSIVVAISLFYSFTTPMNETGEILFELSSSKDYIILIFTILFATVFVIGVCLFLYFLLYGLLMRKLNRNYNELKKLDL
ncbi:hypothetical protein [Pseudofulvibacter geojedonensis]|uniref:Beta-carotene 15,15'-monooxygenase n=1 Tax=Pseudofulvibacter geojedonensis TaxID=1123758 RepID=A0ABW3HZ64_9FLAO